MAYFLKKKNTFSIFERELVFKDVSSSQQVLIIRARESMILSKLALTIYGRENYI